VIQSVERPSAACTCCWLTHNITFIRASGNQGFKLFARFARDLDSYVRVVPSLRPGCGNRKSLFIIAGGDSTTAIKKPHILTASYRTA
jgi:hypothetical protein